MADQSFIYIIKEIMHLLNVHIILSVSCMIAKLKQSLVLVKFYYDTIVIPLLYCNLSL